MIRERGQALVEAVVALPACLACAVMIADAGVVVRDRMAVSQAATRAAEARMDGRDAAAAARSALPRSIRDGARVRIHGGRVEVTADAGSRIARLAGRRVQLRSGVEVPA